MSKTVSQIYTEYKIMPSLQVHMLRVAAVAYLICDNMIEDVSKEDVITACLLHDMGNIIKFKMDVFPEFFEPEGVEYWQGVKDEFMKKYGDNENEATLKISKELGVLERIIVLADQNRFSLICHHKDSSDMEIKITHYADGRVNPHGIVSYEERMAEAGERYKDGKYAHLKDERDRLVDCGKQMEMQIFAKCKIKPEDITDETVALILEELQAFVVE